MGAWRCSSWSARPVSSCRRDTSRRRRAVRSGDPRSCHPSRGRACRDGRRAPGGRGSWSEGCVSERCQLFSPNRVSVASVDVGAASLSVARLGRAVWLITLVAISKRGFGLRSDALPLNESFLEFANDGLELFSPPLQDPSSSVV